MLVCTRCFENRDLKHFIRNAFLESRGEEPSFDERQTSFDEIALDFPARRGSESSAAENLDALPQRDSDDEAEDDAPACDFCGESSSPTAELEDVTAFILERVKVFYSDANEWLMYVSSEGGYQGVYWDSYDLVTDQLELELPNDTNNSLRQAIIDGLEETVWCEYDPWRLSIDDEFVNDWDRFAEFVKHRRRFFFQELGGGDPEVFDDSRSFGELLKSLARLVEEFGMVAEAPAGSVFYRARRNKPSHKWITAQDLGPPPDSTARMSNRMSPPGIPLFYVADERRVAEGELGADQHGLSGGRFEVQRSIRILDLARLPARRGVFSEASREEVLGLNFLHQFAEIISEPIERDDRINVEYVPTQVLTEYFRDFDFPDGKIDGIRYRSSIVQGGTNVVLFALQRDLVDGMRDEDEWRTADPWIRLLETWRTNPTKRGRFKKTQIGPLVNKLKSLLRSWSARRGQPSSNYAERTCKFGGARASHMSKSTR